MAIEVDKVKVQLIGGPSTDPIDLMFSLAKKSVKIDEPTFDVDYLSKTSYEDKAAFIVKTAFGSGHFGILEHVNYTFEVWGVSRAMSHQAVRNRIASFLEGSLRYNDPTKAGFKYIVPMDIRDNPVLRKEYMEDMERAEELYKKWFVVGKSLGLNDARSKELARTTLPHSACTTYGFTMNIASLVRLFNKRLCVRAEAEFRDVAGEMHKELKAELPVIFDHVGTYCEQYGYCPEGVHSCGRYPTLYELRAGYEGTKLSSSLLDN